MPAEINTCRDFLAPTIAEMPKLRAIVALGRIAHETTVKALGAKRSAAAFSHGGTAQIGMLTLFSSYHCSRYNTNTGVLDAGDVPRRVRGGPPASRRLIASSGLNAI